MFLHHIVCQAADTPEGPDGSAADFISRLTTLSKCSLALRADLRFRHPRP